jgi:[glutamine synthetase] adenylyltransferase / [glutamine synthetase]-adenylyl-L-tyrosine phosphorylase
MKPCAEELILACPEVDPRLTRAHAERLDPAYFAAFDTESVCRHLRGLSLLTPENPVEPRLTQAGDGAVECVILAFDYPSEFSLITGLMAGTGFEIESGQVFTYRPARAAPRAHGRTPARRRPDRNEALLRRRRILDFFSGRLSPDVSFAAWRQQFTARLREVLLLMETGAADLTARARHKVNEAVAARLGDGSETGETATLYPVRIEVDNSGACTRFDVIAQDTPAFLYALSAALALREIAIEGVSIRTVEGMVHDRIDVLDLRGRKIVDAERLNQIRLATLLTKQFTSFLGQAPDPYAALSRFERMCEDVLRMGDSGRWVEWLSNPRALGDLARLLGASDYIWEDFVRVQYEVLAPMLESSAPAAPAPETADPRRRLETLLAAAPSFEAKKSALNEFKDRETFRIDLHHILHAGGDPMALAAPLTRLAEAVAHCATAAVRDELRRRHGTPRTVGGLEARYALMALGKFGGEALGYASDIEWLLVYGDQGETDGPEPLSNAEFFGRLSMESARFIQAKREGIFHVDLRLRPYGSSGPAACSLENFCKYYGPQGAAQSFERLALTRLRYVCGDPHLGRQVERLRDAYVYERPAIDIAELRRLRERQFVEKSGGRPNAKFSPGALVDLEYCVQLLQTTRGGENPHLRTPSLRRALDAMARDGTLTDAEQRQLGAAYDFLRRLINGLRMLRGHAQDLFLPDSASPEYAHLARRMGYRRTGNAPQSAGDAGHAGLSPERELLVDFETHTAIVRAFVERRFGREHLPDPGHGNLVDLVLSDRPHPDLVRRALDRCGFRDARRAEVNLRKLAGGGEQRDAFARIAMLAADALRMGPDPDMALNNWERFAASLPDPAAHYGLFLRQPRRLDMLLAIFSGSQFLADTLERHPEFFDWITDPDNLLVPRRPATLLRDMRACAPPDAAPDDLAAALRKFRRREILRIGARDLCLHAPFEEIVADLSLLADTIVSRALEAIAQADGCATIPSGFCVLAFGKLGGAELNYSSDIDLTAVCEDHASGPAAPRLSPQRAARWMGRLCRDLSAHTTEGYAYRVDLRLRPHGSAGGLAATASALRHYYAREAAPWEVQALLKTRPVAGDLAAGHRALAALRPLALRRIAGRDMLREMRHMRRKSAEAAGGASPGNIKTGPGGIRDIEFLVQALQLAHLAAHPDLWEGQTLRALQLLREHEILDETVAETLRRDYVFLRRVEHCLQILEDRQTHSVPDSDAERTVLARRLYGPDGDARRLGADLSAARQRVHGIFDTCAKTPPVPLSERTQEP